VQVVARMASEPVELRGRRIAASDVALVMIGAANRDPKRFKTPNRLDITRGDRDHLAFGGGIHYCLGANLARLEGEIALARLTRRMPELVLTGSPIWRESINLRGLEVLPLRF
jgi:cytochrome P450